MWVQLSRIERSPPKRQAGSSNLPTHTKLEDANMNKLKRVSVRAIIFQDEQLVSMYRERDNRIFYTFPGGGKWDDETQEECVKREIFEETGLIIIPIKKVYIYESETSIEHFYICNYISGQIGTGQGPEYTSYKNNGFYKPMLIEIAKIPTLPLMPPEIADIFYKDYIKNGQNLRENVIHLLKQ